MTENDHRGPGLDPSSGLSEKSLAQSGPAQETSTESNQAISLAVPDVTPFAMLPDAGSTSTLSAPAEAPTPIRVLVSALTDVGCVRTNNEDSFGYDESLGIFVVCDGMGGMASGEVASAHAVTAMVDGFASSACSSCTISSRLLFAIKAANQDVWENAQIPENKGMGTTMVAAAIDGNKLILGNVGDSRAYMIEDGQCVQLTVDHSYLNELIRNGTLTVENAHTADLQGMESVITRAIGVAPEVEPDFFSVELRPGTTVLLATDGLTRYLLQDEIATIVSASPFESVCASLIDCAKQRGGVDNITCILLQAVAR